MTSLWTIHKPNGIMLSSVQRMCRTLFWFHCMDVNFVNVKESKGAGGAVEQTHLHEGTAFFSKVVKILVATNSSPFTSTPFTFVYIMNEICFHLPRFLSIYNFSCSELSLTTFSKPKQENVPAEHHPVTTETLESL